MAQSAGRSDDEFYDELLRHDDRSGSLLFGTYLRMKGVITNEDIFNARMVQKGQNRRIGEIAVERGWMSRDDVERLLIYQEEVGRRFGELAVEFGFLSDGQVNDLLDQIDESYIYFGEALVGMGVLKDDDMVGHLKDFHRLRLHFQSRDS